MPVGKIIYQYYFPDVMQQSRHRTHIRYGIARDPFIQESQDLIRQYRMFPEHFDVMFQKNC